MPISKHKMNALKERYGGKKGERIYYALEQQAKDKEKGKEVKNGKEKRRR